MLNTTTSLALDALHAAGRALDAAREGRGAISNAEYNTATALMNRPDFDGDDEVLEEINADLEEAERTLNGEVILREQAAAIAAELAKRWGATFNDRRFEDFEPTVIEGSHEESDSAWIISWEECPRDSWAWCEELSEVTTELTGGKFFAEAINSWAVGFFPTYR